MENSWVEVGKDCVCIKTDWRYYPDLIAYLIGASYNKEPSPKFMQTYRIVGIETNDTEEVGHKIKLNFNEFPGERWCACGFRPLEKITTEEHKRTTAPVDMEKV